MFLTGVYILYNLGVGVVVGRGSVETVLRRLVRSGEVLGYDVGDGRVVVFVLRGLRESVAAVLEKHNIVGVKFIELSGPITIGGRGGNSPAET